MIYQMGFNVICYTKYKSLKLQLTQKKQNLYLNEHGLIELFAAFGRKTRQC